MTIFNVYKNCRNLEGLEKYFKSIFDGTKTFIACFSAARDNLTMWRSYGRDGRGVCIGFNVEKLNRVIERIEKFNVGKGKSGLLYPPESVGVCLKEVKYVSADCCIDKFETENGRYVFSDLLDGEADEWVAPKSGGELIKRAIDCWSVKSDDYEVEKEWRLIATFDMNYFKDEFLRDNRKYVGNPFRLKYIFSDCMMRERLFIRLAENCIDEIILGPKCSMQKNEIERYLLIYFNERVIVSNSDKMYR